MTTMNNHSDFKSKKAFFGAAIGTMIEYYDYVLFATFMPIFSPVFFAGATVYESLVKGYFVYFITMAARPLGGLLFGRIGDAIGRPKALLLSMYGIAFSTALIGVTPSYTVIGIWASIIIAFAKAMQIFCFGGEYTGAGIYVVEHAQGKREAAAGIRLAAMCGVGALLASIVGILITSEQMPAWSWRIAFILGWIVGVFGVMYRKNLVDSPNFQAANLNTEGFITLLKKFPRQLTAGFFIGAFSTVPITTVCVFVLPVLMTKGLIDSHQLMILQSVMSTVCIISLLLISCVADRITPVRLMRFSCITFIICGYFCLQLVDTFNFIFIIPAIIFIVILNELFFGPANAFLKNIFPMQYRYRGGSFSYCLGMAVLGSTTPLLETYLYQLTDSFATVALWPIGVGIAAYWSIVRLQISTSQINISNNDVLLAHNKHGG